MSVLVFSCFVDCVVDSECVYGQFVNGGGATRSIALVSGFHHVLGNRRIHQKKLMRFFIDVGTIRWVEEEYMGLTEEKNGGN